MAIEDAPRDWTVHTLKEVGFSNRIIDAVCALTRHTYAADRSGKALKEPYFDFIERCSLNPDAVLVKLSDIADNMRDATGEKLIRYTVAQSYLEAVRNGQRSPGHSMLDFVENLSPEGIRNFPGLKQEFPKLSSRADGPAKRIAEQFTHCAPNGQMMLPFGMYAA